MDRLFGIGLHIVFQSRVVKCGGAGQSVQICAYAFICPLAEGLVPHFRSLFRKSVKQSKPVLAHQIIDHDIAAPGPKGGNVKILA